MSTTNGTSLIDVAKHAARAREHTIARDEAIRQAVAEGFSLRTIAETAEMSHSAIAKIAGRCTGHRYLVNADDPSEGTDIHHDGPCPVHP